VESRQSQVTRPVDATHAPPVNIKKTLMNCLFTFAFIFFASEYFVKSYNLLTLGKFSFTIEGTGGGTYEIIAETLAFLAIIAMATTRSIVGNPAK